MNCGENLHWSVARINTLKLLIDFKNTTEFSIERLPRDVCEVEVHAQTIFLNRQTVSGADIKNFTSGDITRHEIPVFRISFFKKVIPLVYWNIFRVTGILWFPRDPDSPTFTTGTFTHQSQFVSTGNRSRVHLDELCIPILHSSLIGATDRATCTNHRHSRSTIQKPTAT